MDHSHGATSERLREHLARAYGELETAQHFLVPGTRDEAHLASACDTLESVRWLTKGSDRG